MDGDTIVVVICNPEDAKVLLQEGDDIKDSLVITPLVNEAIMVPKQEFLDWVYGNEMAVEEESTDE